MNKELSIKSKLLFNNLDMNYKIVLDLSANDTKRKKALDKIFSTYLMTIKPFINDESKDYQNTVYSNINERYRKIEESIDLQTTVEGLIIYLSPILNDLKDMISTCKTTIPKINKLWGISE